MNRTKNKLLAVGLALFTLLSACQKEPTGRLELVAEGMGNASGTKMTVDGVYAYWQDGDKVNINGEEATLSVSSSQAFVLGEFSADNYCIAFPASIYESRSGDMVTIDMPAIYQYRTGHSGDYVYRQVIDAPMAYYGNAAGGKALLKHLTGALNVQISGPSGIVIDSIIVGTTQNRVMSGSMTFDLSDIEHIGSSATNASDHNMITMIGGQVGTVQIPIPVLTGDVNFTVKVKAHKDGTKYAFERTQTTGGHLGRGVMGVVSIDLNEGQPGVVTSALFPTVVIGDKTYYQISTPQDLLLMSTAVWDGDLSFTQRWEYNGLKYKDANYYVMNDIDMSGVFFPGIVDFYGEFNGGNHTIGNLTVSDDNDNFTAWGVFRFLGHSNLTVSIKNTTFDNLTIMTRNNSDHASYCGAIVGRVSAGECTIDNVFINGFKEVNYYGNNTGSHREYILGGFVGELRGNVTITNSNVTFASDQEFTHKSGGMVYFGGVVGTKNDDYNRLITLDNVDVALGTMNFDVSATRRFGGILSDEYYYTTVHPTNTTITGNVVFSAGTNYVGRISSGYNGSMTGVDVSGLTITRN